MLHRLSRPRLAALSLLALALPLAAQELDPVAKKIVDLEGKDPRVSQELEYLVEHVGPRLTGSPNLQRAEEWARARFASFGLDAHLERWGETSVGFERGPSHGGMVAPLRVDYVFGTNAWTPGTPGPVRARAVLQPASEEELQADPDRWRGAWVVDLPRSERPRGAQRRKTDEALAALGIAGRVHGTGQLILTFGNPRVDFDHLPTEVSIQLQKPYFDDLSARLGRGEEVELEFDVDNRFLPGPFPQYNVVADLAGSEFPDQYVVVGGHIDSWDGARGAQDNGTGVATTIEAARLLTEAGAKPRRTIRFMLFSGEEQGLLGSHAYVKAHQDDMARISAVLVHDEGTNYLSGIAGPKALVGDLRSVFAPAAELDPDMPFQVEQNDGLSTFGDSDHASFTAAGVPGFFWEQTGTADYDFIHHTQNDLIEYVVPEYQRHSAVVVALGALGIANLDHLLDRTDLIDPNPRRGWDPKRRLMGVQLDGNEVTQVVDGGMAAGAGWQEGDVIVAIDGKDVAGMGEIVDALQDGGPRKVFRLKRGEKTLETVLDYTGTPSEKARQAEVAAKAAPEPPAEKPAGGAGEDAAQGKPAEAAAGTGGR